jgi:hypothetical protein
MSLNIPRLRARYFPPAVAALLHSRVYSETCMQIGMAGFGSFITADFLSSPADPPVTFLVLGTVAAALVVVGVAIQWRSQRAFLAARGEA